MSVLRRAKTTRLKKWHRPSFGRYLQGVIPPDPISWSSRASHWARFPARLLYAGGQESPSSRKVRRAAGTEREERNWLESKEEPHTIYWPVAADRENTSLGNLATSALAVPWEFKPNSANHRQLLTSAKLCWFACSVL